MEGQYDVIRSAARWTTMDGQPAAGRSDLIQVGTTTHADGTVIHWNDGSHMNVIIRPDGSQFRGDYRETEYAEEVEWQGIYNEWQEAGNENEEMTDEEYEQWKEAMS